ARMPTLLPLWRKARRVSSAASRLPGTTSLRFALHGWQRVTAKNQLSDGGVLQSLLTSALVWLWAELISMEKDCK
ncbi:MAG: hypothetical protein JMN26_10970, partial [gamma proteobacterium endosymbiont of Lamellibrachia anaximandri]|nr:hypothetical protein [gamma proteobacterium endosymbiont of Lamellibrachia anaximandri]